MEHKQVNSSHIYSVAYDAETQVMEVRFSKGGVYQYHDVSPDDHADLVGAESIGTHFGRNIRGKFRGVRVSK